MSIVNKLVKTNIILIIAGNYNEFLDFCAKHLLPIKGKRRAVYVSSTARIMGMRENPFVIIGTAYQRNDFDKIMVQMKIANNYEVQPA